MATPITNTLTTYDQPGARESWASIIDMVDPVSTPLYTNCDKVPARARVHKFQEFQGDGTPTITYRLEGEEPDRGAIKPPVELNNPCSIHWRDYTVSGTVQSVDMAGRQTELAWQRTTNGLQLRQEVEAALSKNNVKVAPADNTTAREMAGLPAWSNDGDGTALDATTPAHTADALDTAATALAQEGAFGDTCIMTPSNKVTFSSTALATTTTAGKSVESAVTERIVANWAGSTSVYLSDFGPVQMVVSRYMDYASYLFDKNHVRVAVMEGRNMVEKVLGPSGDAHQRMMIWEGTLEAGAPKAIATLK